MSWDKSNLAGWPGNIGHGLSFSLNVYQQPVLLMSVWCRKVVWNSCEVICKSNHLEPEVGVQTSWMCDWLSKRRFMLVVKTACKFYNQSMCHYFLFMNSVYLLDSFIRTCQFHPPPSTFTTKFCLYNQN